MLKRVMGLEFSDTRILIAELFKDRKKLRVNKCTQMNLPNSTIVNGEVQNLEVLTDQLRLLCCKVPMLKGIPVVVGISGMLAFVRKLTLPVVPLRELKKIIRWEGENILPYTIDEVVYSYQVLHTSFEEMQVLFVAMLKEKFKQYQEVFQKSKLYVQSLSFQPFGLVNYSEFAGELINFAGILVRVLDDYCDLVLVDHGSVELVRTISFDGVNSEKSKFDVLISELVSTLEHFQALKDIWLNSGIFFGSREFLEILRTEMPTFHWRYLTLGSQNDSVNCSDEYAIQLPAIWGLALPEVIRA